MMVDVKFLLPFACLMKFGFLLSQIEVQDIKYWQPEQIHLSLGGTVTVIVVSWMTTDDTEVSVVDYGTKSLNQRNIGSPVLFVDGGTEHRKMWMHRVHLHDLQPDTRYYYRCGSDLGWSPIFSFKTLKFGTDWSVHLALFGDMGAENPQSLSRLQVETEDGMYDVVLHIGDFAYDMDSDNARVGDEFMKQIESIAAYVPYMTCPGNHENKYNFSNYRARFAMPQYSASESMFYSWDVGPVHFIAVNTEAYYFLVYGLKPLVSMYTWLQNDLEAANQPAARADHPWIILYGHRPMYCSNSDNDDCTRVDCLTRVGLPLINGFGMESLLYKYGVDLAIWAHEHSYERLWPLYNFTVLNGSMAHPYTNPRAPVHIITGSAGCKERHDNFIRPKPYWSAFRNNDYGYTRLTVFNKTHLYWEQVSDDKGGEIVDSTWLIKDFHKSYLELPLSKEE